MDERQLRIKDVTERLDKTLDAIMMEYNITAAELCGILYISMHSIAMRSFEGVEGEDE